MSHQGTLNQGTLSTGGNLNTLSGGTGAVVHPNQSGNIIIRGTDGIQVASSPATNSLNISGTSSLEAITPFIVGKTNAPYTTIQSAIDAATEDSIVYIKEGQYNEDLVFPDSVNLVGQGTQNVAIVGTHDLRGNTSFVSRIISFYSDNGNSFNLGASGGDIGIICEQCEFNVLNPSTGARSQIFGATARGVNIELVSCNTGQRDQHLGIINCTGTSRSSFYFNGLIMQYLSHEAETTLQGDIFIKNSVIQGIVNINSDSRDTIIYDTTFNDASVKITSKEDSTGAKGITIDRCLFEEATTGNALTLNGRQLTNQSIHVSNSTFRATRTPIQGNVNGNVRLIGNEFTHNNAITLANATVSAGNHYSSSYKSDYSGVLVGTGTNQNIRSTRVLENGQLLIGSTGNIPQAGHITSSNNSVQITNSSGAIDLQTSTANIIEWEVVNSPKLTEAGHGYIIESPSFRNLVLDLPFTNTQEFANRVPLGSVIYFLIRSAITLQVHLSVGQQIFSPFGNSTRQERGSTNRPPTYPQKYVQISERYGLLKMRFMNSYANPSFSQSSTATLFGDWVIENEKHNFTYGEEG